MILVVLAPVGEDRRAALLEGLNGPRLKDVRVAVADFDAMTALMKTRRGKNWPLPRHPRSGVYDLGTNTSPSSDWLTADRFVFLGARVYDYPRTAAGDYAAEEPVFTAGGRA